MNMVKVSLVSVFLGVMCGAVMADVPVVGEAVKTTADRKCATPETAAVNRAVLGFLDFTDTMEPAFAMRGLVDPGNSRITNCAGRVVWDAARYAYMTNACYSSPASIPSEVNPSLWRDTVMNQYAGLFEVIAGEVYQVRGFDMANMTFVRAPATDRWFVLDVLMCEENASVAKAIMSDYLRAHPEKFSEKARELDIVALVYSHSHIDHFGGVKGLVPPERIEAPHLGFEGDGRDPDQAGAVEAGRTAVLAPNGFLAYAASENVYAGRAMGRRAQYQYGVHLTPGVKGKMGIGIGLGQATGTSGLYAPTRLVRRSNLWGTDADRTCVFDGLEMRFQLTPGTEAPAEMNIYFPRLKMLWMAENCTATLHNLYTLRGAQVRDGADWSRYILESVDQFVDSAEAGVEVVVQSHNWPHWNEDGYSVRDYMMNTAAVYRYINDQTLHLINLGYTANEISNTLRLPERLAKIWYTRQYYGTVSHNSRAVYQKYMGWYDANPVNLNPLEPTAAARKIVEYLGDERLVLAKAVSDFEKGEYQWVAQITKELVYANPTNRAARELCADALEQLGYQAESGTWRNCYLTGARELREGNQAVKLPPVNAAPDDDYNVQMAMTADMVLDFVGISTDAAAAQAGGDYSFTVRITDSDRTHFRVQMRDGVLLVTRLARPPAEDALDVVCTEKGLLKALLKGDPSGVVKGYDVLLRLRSTMTAFPGTFNVVEP